MTDVEIHQPQTSLTEQMRYASTVADGSLLPDIYRRNPANVLIAVGLGQSMGLSPAESLYRISVIKGKPSAGAELIASNVRKAGHKLRVRGDATSCTATIIRADDPDFPFEVTRDMAWAQGMGLASNDNYRKQPGTMLQWRAITAVARLACPEALYGVSYTPDELEDSSPHVEAAPSRRVSAADFTKPEPIVEAEPEPEQPEQPEPDLITPQQLKKLQILVKEKLGGDRATALRFASDEIGRQIQTSKELTKAEASQVIDSLSEQIDDAAEPVDAEPERFDGNDPWATGVQA